MNFIFISPQFPHTYWEFCRRLKQNGITVLGIGDAPYESLSNELKGSLDDWYFVPDMEDYGRMYRAVAFLASKWGRIDWIESNNEYWLAQDARLRTDFNVRTGIQTDHIDAIKEKSEMKRYYALAGVPSARQIRAAEGEEAVRAFAGKTGYPVFAKPDIGVGANGTYKINDSGDLSAFFRDEKEWRHYVVEEFVQGDIASYDAIVGRGGEPLFESMTMWPPSVADIVKGHLDLSYYVSPVGEGARHGEGLRRLQPLRPPRVLRPRLRPPGPREEGRLCRSRGQHAPRGRLHPGHDQLRPQHRCL